MSINLRPSTAAPALPAPPPPPPSLNPTLTTSLYRTHIGLFALTWSKTLFGRSLHLNLLLHGGGGDDEYSPASLSDHSFNLHIKPFLFWKKQGSKKLSLVNNHQPARIFWDLSKAKFGSGPEPVSGFYIAVVVDKEIALLVGDSNKQAYSKIKSITKSEKLPRSQIAVVRREHVHGISNNRRYTTKAVFGGKTKDISIDCRLGEHDSRLIFYVDGKRVLQVKHLKWKFRGNERVEIDGVNVQVSWDVYNWLFEEEREEGYALFMFRFEKSGFDYHNDDNYLTQLGGSGSGFGLDFETKKMKMKKKRMLGNTRSSSSSSSFSSASSGCGSVMDWESMEENELKGPSGFSLLVYAWKS